MSRELFFLVSAHRDDSDVPLEDFVKIKTPGPKPNPVVAFPSEVLGRQLILGRGLDRYCFLKPAEDLGVENLNRAKALPILLFERADQVTKYLADGERFDYSTLTFSYDEAVQKLTIVP